MPSTNYVRGGLVMPPTDYATGMRAWQSRMIDAWGRRPICTHQAKGVGLAEFVVNRSGASWDDVEVLECRDVHLFARLLMRSNYVARTDRELLGVDRRADRDALPFTHGSLWLAWTLGGLTLFTLVGFGRLLAGLIW